MWWLVLVLALGVCVYAYLVALRQGRLTKPPVFIWFEGGPCHGHYGYSMDEKPDHLDVVRDDVAVGRYYDTGETRLEGGVALHVFQWKG